MLGTRTNYSLFILKAQFVTALSIHQDNINPQILLRNRAKKVLVTPLVEFGNTESTPPVAEPRYSFSFEVSQEVMDLYTEARAIMGHLKPEQVFERALKHFIAQKKQAPRVIKAKVIVKQDKQVTSKSRAVPLNTRRTVLERDNYQCTYCAADGKQESAVHSV